MDGLLSALLGVLGGLVVISVLVHAYTLWRFSEYPDVGRLKKEVETLRLEVTDLVDRVDSWQRRDRTRNIRAAKAEEDAQIANSIPAPLSLKERKARLRTLMVSQRR